jgi:hypothetical protein
MLVRFLGGPATFNGEQVLGRCNLLLRKVLSLRQNLEKSAIFPPGESWLKSSMVKGCSFSVSSGGGFFASSGGGFLALDSLCFLFLFRGSLVIGLKNDHTERLFSMSLLFNFNTMMSEDGGRTARLENRLVSHSRGQSRNSHSQSLTVKVQCQRCSGRHRCRQVGCSRGWQRCVRLWTSRLFKRTAIVENSGPR